MELTVTKNSPALPVVVGWSGASGAVYGVRLVETLLLVGVDLRLVVSPAARLVLRQETGYIFPDPATDTAAMQEEIAAAIPAIGTALRTPGTGRLVVERCDDLASSVASGSFPTRAMVVCPCSTATLGALACGAGRNLLHRAAEVHLKERRPLILVLRETPLSLITLRNMATLTEAGAMILPASPGFYGPHGAVADLIDFIVARILDQLGVAHRFGIRYSGGSGSGSGPVGSVGSGDGGVAGPLP